jgi:ABC-type phosphonate transport system ATPase subunit
MDILIKLLAQKAHNIKECLLVLWSTLTVIELSAERLLRVHDEHLFHKGNTHNVCEDIFSMQLL